MEDIPLQATLMTVGPSMSLEKELETYKRELSRLLAEQGKYVLIIGEEVVGTFAAYEDALKEGYERARLKPFLVKQIDATEQVHQFTRNLEGECRT